MKFVCGECQAKYQIPDERVAGRKLKIRCRKCGAAIHLRGDTYASAVGEAAPSIEWHVAIDGQQHGPYPTEQMASMLRDGDLGWDASVWRDGYADWQDADASDTLVRAVASLAETRYSAPPSMASEVRTSSPSIVPEYDEEDPTRMTQNQLPDEELPTRMVHNALLPEELPTRMVQQSRPASVSPVSGIAPVRRAASVSPAAGLAPARARAVSVAPIAAVAAVRSPSVVPVRAPAPMAAYMQAPAPMAVRTEDLSYAVARLSAAPAPIAPRGGYASGEGSGLIDIRALAALTHGGGTRPAPVPQARGRMTAPADVMVPLGAPSSPFGNIDSLRPFERPKRSGGSKALPIAIVAGSSIIAAAAIAIVFLTRRQEEAAAVAAQPEAAPIAAAAAALPEPAAAAEPTGLPVAAASPTAALADAVEPQAPAAEQEDEAAEDDDGESAKSRAGSSVAAARKASKAKSGGKAVKSGAGAAKAKAADDDKAEDDADDLLGKPLEAAVAPAPEKPSPSIDDLLAGKDKPSAPTESKPKPAPSANRSIDELLDGAVEKKGGASAPAAAAGGNLPETPGRDEVKSTMQGIESEVRACAAGQTLETPTATVAVTVTGSTGRVQSVRVTGNQGVVGSCIARVVRGAKFSPFSKPQFVFNFPYKLK